MTHEEERIDAQAKCVPCKLCGGAAKITDAGSGWGYFIACENASVKRERIQQGCMVGETRISGHAYNVMKLWNRLHGPSPETRTVGISPLSPSKVREE